MKFLIIGLGSMGKRRIRNLLFHKISPKNIFGFDIAKVSCQETQDKYGITSFNDFKKADEEVHPDVYIISTPPNLHHPYFLHAARNKKHFFVEVTTTTKGYKELFPLIKNQNFIAAPSCTFRYFYPIKKMRQMIEENKIGKVLAFTYHMGQYLPDWHSWEDYRKVYFAQRDTSAIKEMIPYELNWLQWLLNTDVANIDGLRTKISTLEMDAEDIAIGIVKMKNNVFGTLIIDVISRAPFRTLKLLGTNGVLEWEWQAHTISLYNAKIKKWHTYKLPTGKEKRNYITIEGMYQDELKDFLWAINGKRHYPYTFTQDYQNLRLIEKFNER